MRGLAALIVAILAGIATASAGAATFEVDVCASNPGLSWLAATPSNSQPATLTARVDRRRASACARCCADVVVTRGDGDVGVSGRRRGRGEVRGRRAR